MADTELESRFSPNKPLEPDVAAELRSMMRLHDLSAEDVFYKWESFCIKMDIDAQQVTLEAVRNLKQNIQDALEKDQRQQGRSDAQRKAVAATPRAHAGTDMLGMLDGMVPSTPVSGARKLGRPGLGNTSASGRKRDRDGAFGSSPAGGPRERLQDGSGSQPYSFSARRNAGQVVEILNERLKAAEPPLAPYGESRIKLTAASDQKKMAYRPLAMKLSEASEILDDRIDDFAELVQTHHGLPDSALGSAASQSTAEVVAVGRIASDSSEGRLNAASLVLEMSRRTGMGLRVPLRMDRVACWSFFPGQVVAVRGTNASGSEFVVDEVLSVPLLANAASNQSALKAHRHRLATAVDSDAAGEPAPLSILFASGPYTADDNVDYEPLDALCRQAADSYADALILAGPFLDAHHPLVATGSFDLPPEANYDADTATMATVFRCLFAPALNRLASSSPHTTIILVPSVHDVISKHVSWPQDAMPRRELGLPKTARIVSNPMTLSINEVVMGLCSQDTLYQLRGEELVHGASPGDSKGRLGRYLLEQRHYFPLFPPMDRSRLPKTGIDEGLATGAALDLSYLKLGEMVNVRPDVMLTPSALPPFAMVVESVLMINPGHLSKRRGPGTYARMSLYAPKVNADAADKMVSHEVYDRARVEIVRI
ncbi:hypothetical protein CDD82_4143 [Ophiocordyceps australis]|uniref:DNA polymerase alpha subunit B n=1 Tax=Ophiocordyceps australis TaxID=1399860 RepID=A0A2C5Z8R3_9HYPO|nr:hypothetical protein CDD82_4143 [Ophiocordyceps australis]